MTEQGPQGDQDIIDSYEKALDKMAVQIYYYFEGLIDGVDVEIEGKKSWNTGVNTIDGKILRGDQEFQHLNLRRQSFEHTRDHVLKIIGRPMPKPEEEVGDASGNSEN